MHRILASLFADEPIELPDDSGEPTEADRLREAEALCDLRSTYDQPIKATDRSTSKRFVDARNSESVLKQRELGLVNFRRSTYARHRLMDRFLPDEGEVVASMARPTFCGQFSDDGKCFISACQDYCLRLYDTSSSQSFERLAQIEVDEVGWSILDTALSPDRRSIAYSTWSDYIYLVRLNDQQEQTSIDPLYLRPEANSFSIFSLQYSADGSEIIGGSNDTCVYVYDLQQQRRTLRVQAHQNDVNAVRFIDNSNSLLVSGSDDSLVLVWDRRALNEAQPKPVGIFAGHTSGITFVHSRMDTRYLISNSKDQTIKLWDMRRFADEETIERCCASSNAINRLWDYRVGAQPQTLQRRKIAGDPSVQTYRGHSVGYTLIRCYFSPSFTTGQRYIITGSSDGCIYIYDVLTGHIERRLSIRNNNYGSGRERCVRDVSWHPYEHFIVSTSWDNRRAHVRWTHRPNISSEPSLSPPVETKIANVQTSSPPSSPRLSIQPATLQRFLIENLLGINYNDEDSSPEE